MNDATTSPLPRLAPRNPRSHKGDYGRTLVVGGSLRMSGAIVLAGKATLRSGAGLVTLAVPRTIQNIVAAAEPSYMTLALADDGEQIGLAAAKQIVEILPRFSVVAFGPGLGRSEELTRLAARCYREVSQSMVVDADALNALADGHEPLAHPGGPRILTPHPGELARLLRLSKDQSTAATTDDHKRVELASELARRDPNGKSIVVLKGHRTVICDAKQFAFNSTGNPGMATGGTGDCLTGIIAGLLCQGLAPFDAARLGAHVHGLAGDLAAKELGEISLIASDLIDFLPSAFRTLTLDP